MEARIAELTIRVLVHDEEALTAFARKRYDACWQDPDWTPESIGEALYESLVASNGTTESPLDYGIELCSWSASGA